MRFSLIHRTDALVICAVLFAGMIVFFSIGRLISKAFLKDEDQVLHGVSSLTAALFALFGFILALSFSFSVGRYDNVRNSFLEESNQISTAIARADLYPDSLRTAFREDFREYLEGRISLYSNLTDLSVLEKAEARQARLEKQLWQRTAQQFRQPNLLPASNMMIPALNNMFNSTAKRKAVMKMVTPESIIYMLLTLAMVSSFIAGVNSPVVKRKGWIIIVCFVFFSTLIIYIILDLGRPLRGWITAGTAEQAIVDLRNLFK